MLSLASRKTNGNCAVINHGINAMKAISLLIKFK
jgi:hypothetical protein